MKKLITIILILALAVPALALADGFYITDHYALTINSNADSAKMLYNTKIFDFDSKTVDLFFTSEEGTAYIITTTCISNIFFSSGMQKVKIVTLGGQTYVVDESGDHMALDWDENGDLWIDFGLSYFLMHHVENMDALHDRK